MRFSLPFTSSSELAGDAAAAAADAVDDDEFSVGSSLSSRSAGSNNDHPHHSPTTFENGMLVKPINDTVLLEQAADSLQSALVLIDEARDTQKSWVDARDLLDRTAAALDDAGLALRGRRGSVLSIGSSKQNSIGSRRSKKTADADDISTASNSDEALVRQLADRVIDQRRSLLGDVLVHDADGPWAKMEYGDGDGISFQGDVLSRVDDEEKVDKAVIVWSSQTGTAKSFAKRLFKSLGGNDRCVLRSTEDVTTVQELAKYKRIYFVVSTFGFGRPPSMAEVFYSILQLGAMQYADNADLCEGDEEMSPKALEGTSVAIASLGSSAFPNFAMFGIDLARELTALGAAFIKDVTKIDAKNGKAAQKEAFKAWQAEIVELEMERLGSGERSLESKLGINKLKGSGKVHAAASSGEHKGKSLKLPNLRGGGVRSRASLSNSAKGA